LGGNGTIGNLSVTGGTLAPGNSIGTLTVGNLSLDAASTLEIEVNSNATSDIVSANGLVSLGGASLVIREIAGSMFAASDFFEFTIIENDGADAVSGTFGTIDNDLAFLETNLLYSGGDGNDVVLQLGQDRVFPEVAQTFNQTQAATALATFDRTAGSDSDSVFTQILVSSEDVARSAFDNSSGEIYASLLADQTGAALGRSQRLLARANEQTGEGWGTWGGVSGRTGSTDGDGNAARIDQGSYSFDLGMDYRGTDNAWALGASVGYIHGNLDVDSRLSRADYDGWSLGGYARYGSGNANLSISAAVHYSDIEVNIARLVKVNTLSRNAAGTSDLDAFSLAGEARYGVALADSDWALGPVVSINHANTELGRVSEFGAGALNLSGNGNGHNQTRYGGGIFANWQGEKGGMDASAQYTDGSSKFAQSTFRLEGAPSSTFAVRSSEIDGQAGLLTLTGHYDLGSDWTLSGEARALVGSDYSDVAGSITLGWRF
jgi:uncharacterized protein with beta-barrel porin domain